MTYPASVLDVRLACRRASSGAAILPGGPILGLRKKAGSRAVPRGRSCVHETAREAPVSSTRQGFPALSQRKSSDFPGFATANPALNTSIARESKIAAGDPHGDALSGRVGVRRCI